MSEIKRTFFGMKNVYGGVSIGQEIRIEFYPMGDRSSVTVEKSDAVYVSHTRLFWRTDLTEQEGEKVFDQVVAAFRVICHENLLQWEKETGMMVNERI